jgi:hypothetical protein
VLKNPLSSSCKIIAKAIGPPPGSWFMNDWRGWVSERILSNQRKLSTSIYGYGNGSIRHPLSPFNGAFLVLGNVDCILQVFTPSRKNSKVTIVARNAHQKGRAASDSAFPVFPALKISTCLHFVLSSKTGNPHQPHSLTKESNKRPQQLFQSAHQVLRNRLLVPKCWSDRVP